MKHLILVILLIPTILFSQDHRFQIDYNEGSIKKTFLIENNKLFKISGTIEEIYIFSSNSIAKEYLTNLDQSLKPRIKYRIGKTTLFVDSAESISYYSINTPSGSIGQIKSINNITFTYLSKASFNQNAGVVGELSKIGNIKVNYYTDLAKGKHRGKIKYLGNKKFNYQPWSTWGEKAGIVGELTSIGNMKINYYDTDYAIGFKGKLKSIGNVKFTYFLDKAENRIAGIVGKFKQQTGKDSRLIIR